VPGRDRDPGNTRTRNGLRARARSRRDRRRRARSGPVPHIGRDHRARLGRRRLRSRGRVGVLGLRGGRRGAQSSRDRRRMPRHASVPGRGPDHECRGQRRRPGGRSGRRHRGSGAGSDLRLGGRRRRTLRSLRLCGGRLGRRSRLRRRHHLGRRCGQGRRGRRRRLGRRRCRRRLRGGRGRRRARGHGARRQEPERVEVAVGLGREAYAQMDVWNGPFGVPGRAERADRRSFGDRRIARDRDRAEMDERDGVAVRSPDRDREAVSRHRAGERDAASARGEDRAPGASAHVQTAMLAPSVRVGSEAEGAENLSRGRPRPRGRRGGEEQRCQPGDGRCSQDRQHAGMVDTGNHVVKFGYSFVTGSAGRARSGRLLSALRPDRRRAGGAGRPPRARRPPPPPRRRPAEGAAPARARS
jgi:hypothetical protein